MSTQKFKCCSIMKGKVQSQLLVSKDAFCFYLVEPDTGVVVEKDHSLNGQSVAGKILVVPAGKGSSVVQMDGLFKLIQRNNAPVGMIVQHPEPVLVSALIILGIPAVYDMPDTFWAGDWNGRSVVLDAINGVVLMED